MSAALTERLFCIAKAAQQAGYGQKEAVYQAACEDLQMSRTTLLKKLKAVQPATPRKRRADAGSTALERDEAVIISAAWVQARRDNDKRLYALDNLVRALRTDGKISAGRIDELTGEFLPLSTGAIARALRGYRLHYDQLQNPAPALTLASLHPNHVWQIDASLCVLYYLKNPDKKCRDSGLRLMDRDTFYKNKPKNLDKILADRVWSFELIDHTTHWIYVEYAFGGETAENFLNVMINAMQERGGADVLHGVPRILYTDPGSALVSASLMNLCRCLGIQCLRHKARNARATGAVEKARDIIECDFEAGLRFVQVDDINQLNQYARLWRMNYNRSKIHRRHGMTRTDGWLRISADQLVKAPSVEVCRELAISAPQERTVDSKLLVPFRGKQYSVRDIPDASVGDKLKIARNPWHEDEARVVMVDENGIEQYLPVYAVQKSEIWQYDTAAPVIGQRYSTIPQTTAQRHRAEVDQLAYGTSNKEETQAAKKAKKLPFNGEFNPWREMEREAPAAYLPRKGREVQVSVRTRVEEKPLSHVQAAMALRQILTAQGQEWNTTFYQYLTSHYPDGVAADSLDALAAELISQAADVVQALRAAP